MDHQFSIGTIFSIPYIFNDFNHHLHCLNDSKCSRRPRTRRHTHVRTHTPHTHDQSKTEVWQLKDAQVVTPHSLGAQVASPHSLGAQVDNQHIHSYPNPIVVSLISSGHRVNYMWKFIFFVFVFIRISIFSYSYSGKFIFFVKDRYMFGTWMG